MEVMDNYDRQRPEVGSPWAFGLTWGAYLAGIGMLLAVLSFLLGLHTAKWFGYASLFLMLAFIVFAGTRYQDAQYDKEATFGQIFKAAFAVTLVGMVLGAVFNWIFYAFIAPSALQDLLDGIMAEYDAAGLSESQIEQSMEMMGFMFTPAGIAIMGAINGILFGLIASLIAGAFNKAR